jgi:urea transporter/murein DD-endopeptidase MepM/ murein hydrolase activator NlpD
MKAFLSPAKLFLDAVLYAYAQILFSNRRWFGALLVLATFFHPTSALLALAGVLLSTALAHFLKFDAARIQTGFYGFNGILLGAAYGYYLDLTPFLLALFPVFVVITFFIAAALENYLAAGFNLPGLSLPFMLSLYITLVFLRNYESGIVHSRSLDTVSGLAFLPEGIQYYLHSLALILFQSNLGAGLVIALGLLVFSRVLFILTVAAFAACALYVNWLLPDQSSSFLVLCGLNSVLTAIALGGSLIIPSRKSFVLALLAVLMSVVFTGFFVRIGTATNLPIMVLPFNLIVLGTLYSLKFRQKASGLTLLYFAPGSPEENYYYHHTSRARFERFNLFMADLPFSGEWLVSQGHEGDETHRSDWRYALDFVVQGENGATYENRGERLDDYFAFRLPVTAPLDGEVVRVVDGIPDNRVGEVNLTQNWGNTVILKHGEGFYSSLSHLESGSLRVQPGAFVRRGEMVALCGNSGRSPVPHLHFQFQATPKLGDKTLSYPIGYYIERNGSGPRLCMNDIPSHGMILQNLQADRRVADAFAFPLEGRHTWICNSGSNTEHEEVWESKVDIYNAPYLESSARAWLGFFTREKLFSLTGFRGHRESALYYFYLCAPQVPLALHNGLEWRDVVPLSKVLRSIARPLSEFLLLIEPQIRADVYFRVHESHSSRDAAVIDSRLEIKGRGLFTPFKRTLRGELRIGADGRIGGFNYYRKEHLIFSATRKD